MRGREWKAGTPIVFVKLKHGSCPGPRAREIHPETRGEHYLYRVDKFWIVLEDRGDSLLVLTRSGKQHVIRCSDPNLRRATWWEWLRFRDRFPHLPASARTEAADAAAQVSAAQVSAERAGASPARFTRPTAIRE